MTTPKPTAAQVALLTSGGLDSAVLLGELLAEGARVDPLYVRCGLRWETAELRQIARLLAALNSPALQQLKVLEMPVEDLFTEHWSLLGPGVPDGATRDEAVFLPGRNVLLLSKAMLWCHLRGVPAVAIATLRDNPFPDATPDFIATLESAVNQAVGGRVRIEQPYAALTKREVLLRGRAMPLELTLSCLSPIAEMHCGVCNKCAERRRAFAAAGLLDRTQYAAVAHDAKA